MLFFLYDGNKKISRRNVRFIKHYCFSVHRVILHDSKYKPLLYISCPSTEDQAEYKKYQENKEQDLRNTSRTGSNTTETKDGGDNSNNQKDNRPA